MEPLLHMSHNLDSYYTALVSFTSAQKRKPEQATFTWSVPDARGLRSRFLH